MHYEIEGRMSIITILPSEQQLVAEKGTKLLDVLSAAGIFKDKALCFGTGVCGGCDLFMISGKLKQRVKACQMVLEEDCAIELMDDSALSMNILTAGKVEEFAAEPCCKSIQVQLQSEVANEWSRLQDAVLKLGYHYSRPALPVLRQLVDEASRSDSLVLVGSQEKLLAVRPANAPGRVCGLAFDLGTTTVAGYLYDLADGSLLSTSSIINPQTSVGSDLLSRIHYTSIDRIGTRKLARMIQLGLKDVTEHLLQTAQVSRNEVYEVVVAGNTCMQQLLLELPSTGLGQSPYRPVTTDPVRCHSLDIGLHLNEMTSVYCLPCIGGFVGGDTVGMLVSCLPEREEDTKEISLAIDIGTNCEIVLSAPHLRLACSAAAGPAFEGGAVSQGMWASEGAIDQVRIDGDVSVHVIGNIPAQGLCGSGLVDAVAELLKTGLIDPDGRMLNWNECEQKKLDPRLIERLAGVEGVQTFILSGSHKGESENSVSLTQLDIRQLQLAKSAIQTSVCILLEMAGVRLEDIDKVFLAGAFGNYIDRRNAAQIGIIPPKLVDRVTTVGNAAGAGASRVLLSVKAREKAEWLAQSTRHVSLADHPKFQSLFLDHLSFAAIE
jgi:uncharacterized 2Fe-2S/4Fe-4S cluster protein (DUF4445 family)